MTLWLKVSTAVTVQVGPFCDQTDGFTAETGLTISQADIRLTKNGGAFAQTNNAAGATHSENGYYGVPLNTTDTNTLGTLRVAVNESGALPAWQDFMVVTAQVWDSLFGADLLQVDTREVGGTTQTAGDIMADTNDIQSRLPAALVSGRMDSSVGAMAANTMTAAAAAADLTTELQSGLATSAEVAGVQSDTNDIQTRLPAALVGGRMDSSVGAIAANAITAAATAADFGTEVADAVWAKALETGFSADRILRIVAAAVAGKVSGGPGSPVFRNLQDTGNVVTGTADSQGNRTAASYGA